MIAKPGTGRRGLARLNLRGWRLTAALVFTTLAAVRRRADPCGRRRGYGFDNTRIPDGL